MPYFYASPPHTRRKPLYQTEIPACTVGFLALTTRHMGDERRIHPGVLALQLRDFLRHYMIPQPRGAFYPTEQQRAVHTDTNELDHPYAVAYTVPTDMVIDALLEIGRYDATTMEDKEKKRVALRLADTLSELGLIHFEPLGFNTDELPSKSLGWLDAKHWRITITNWVRWSRDELQAIWATVGTPDGLTLGQFRNLLWLFRRRNIQPWSRFVPFRRRLPIFDESKRMSLLDMRKVPACPVTWATYTRMIVVQHIRAVLGGGADYECGSPRPARIRAIKKKHRFYVDPRTKQVTRDKAILQEEVTEALQGEQIKRRAWPISHETAAKIMNTSVITQKRYLTPRNLIVVLPQAHDLQTIVDSAVVGALKETVKKRGLALRFRPDEKGAYSIEYDRPNRILYKDKYRNWCYAETPEMLYVNQAWEIKSSQDFLPDKRILERVTVSYHEKHGTYPNPKVARGRSTGVLRANLVRYEELAPPLRHEATQDALREAGLDLHPSGLAKVVRPPTRGHGCLASQRKNGKKRFSTHHPDDPTNVGLYINQRAILRHVKARDIRTLMILDPEIESVPEARRALCTKVGYQMKHKTKQKREQRVAVEEVKQEALDHTRYRMDLESYSARYKKAMDARERGKNVPLPAKPRLQSDDREVLRIKLPPEPPFKLAKGFVALEEQRHEIEDKKQAIYKVMRSTHEQIAKEQTVSPRRKVLARLNGRIEALADRLTHLEYLLGKIDDAQYREDPRKVEDYLKSSEERAAEKERLAEEARELEREVWQARYQDQMRARQQQERVKQAPTAPQEAVVTPASFIRGPSLEDQLHDQHVLHARAMVKDCAAGHVLQNPAFLAAFRKEAKQKLRTMEDWGQDEDDVDAGREKPNEPRTVGGRFHRSSPGG